MTFSLFLRTWSSIFFCSKNYQIWWTYWMGMKSSVWKLAGIFVSAGPTR
jgi:hypothetical protein